MYLGSVIIYAYNAHYIKYAENRFVLFYFRFFFALAFISLRFIYGCGWSGLVLLLLLLLSSFFVPSHFVSARIIQCICLCLRSRATSLTCIRFHRRTILFSEFCKSKSERERERESVTKIYGDGNTC